MEAFELRLWDGRLGRWLTVDPKREFFSPYLGMGNNPISLTDPDGGSTSGGGDNCEGCPENARIGDTFNHPDFGTITYQKNGWGTDVGLILDTVSFTTLSLQVDNSSTTNNNNFGNQVMVFALSMMITQISNNMTFGAVQTPYVAKGTDFELAERLGRLAGDVGSLVQGLSEDGVAGGAEYITLGGATVPAGALATHGTALALGSTYATGKEIGGLVDYFSKKGHGSGSFNFKKITDSLLKSSGLDAHAIKKEFLGNKAPIAQYDLYSNNVTGEIFIFKKGGSGEGIATGYYIK